RTPSPPGWSRAWSSGCSGAATTTPSSCGCFTCCTGRTAWTRGRCWCGTCRACAARAWTSRWLFSSLGPARCCPRRAWKTPPPSVPRAPTRGAPRAR
ncbi:hypothetical protein H632_c5629p0, partial [Helicosporidium sp. ATCC 50920]